jgi:hypothetical protein
MLGGRASQECRANFGTGGKSCLVTGSSCWTGGVCGKSGGGLCESENDCTYDNPPIVREGPPDPLETGMFVVSQSGAKAIRARAKLHPENVLDRLLADMLDLRGGIMVGPIESGLMLIGNTTASFTGLIRRDENGGLVAQLKLEGHPAGMTRIEAEIAPRGEHVRRKVTY